ncbi:MAG TPA: energy transducer TonB [Saprospiraceae bacterium]|jgi:periplasmic protein TonB
MRRYLFFGVALFSFWIGACKSDNKEAASETAVDTTKVAEPVGVISYDSIGLVAYEEEVKKKPAPKPAATDKTTTTPKTSSATKPAEASKTTTTAPTADAPATGEVITPEGYVEFPSKRATYPGGQAALNQYLADNIKYPAMARENLIEGTVYAKILVDELGTIVDVSFPKPLGYGLEEEVLRVIKGMPKLIPAEDHSKPVKTMYTLPVKFKLH